MTIAHKCISDSGLLLCRVQTSCVVGKGEVQVVLDNALRSTRDENGRRLTFDKEKGIAIEAETQQVKRWTGTAAAVETEGSSVLIAPPR